MKLIIAFIMILSFTDANADSAYAPVNEATRVRTIKYLNQGADFIIKSRREDAYKDMYDACNGKYRIESEGPKAEGGYNMDFSKDLSIWGQTQYWYINYSCVTAEKSSFPSP